jgi:acetoacetyl-CoA synthetase
MPTEDHGSAAGSGEDQPSAGAATVADAPGAAGEASAAAMLAKAGRDYGSLLWEPDAQVTANAKITAYANWLDAEHGVSLRGYEELWQWSVDDPGRFWGTVWDYFGVLGDRGEGPVLSGGPMPDVRWFTGATLNYARNALSSAQTNPERTAVIFRSEGGRAGALSYAELDLQVARVREALRALGVAKGDRVAAYLPNTPEALIGLLATASLGAIWSSCSPDFGARSVIDRFAQITPKVLIAVDGYVYGGKSFDRRTEVAGIASALPGLEAVIMIDYLAAAGGEASGEAAGVAGSEVRGDALGETGSQVPAGGLGELRVPVLPWDALPGGGPAADGGAGPAAFEEVPFDHPLWILYSSGTTGLPKPIVHGHGGIVLEHLKVLVFHQDLGPDDVFFWYTTTGWMMWNYLAGGLLAGATVVAYDGSATHPGIDALWRLAAEAGVSYAGTGAPYLLACMKAGLRPAAQHDLSRLRGVGSTGSPLPPEGFRWVYAEVAAEGSDLVLGSVSGGTDLCTGFVGPCPLLPVRAGVISGRCLGAEVEAYDPGGHPLVGAVGELVITRPMPSMPVRFWNDPGGQRYLASYFADFPGVWRHGDWIMMLPDGGCVIYGRSDATLNRGGVRMGTSEFYRVVEGLPEVADSLVIDTGQLGQDGRLLLYVVLDGGQELDDELARRIRSQLRTQLSPRHVPDEIHQVPGIPRTLSGKKLEVPVRKILQGTPVADAADPDALANPEVLGFFAPGGQR